MSTLRTLYLRDLSKADRRALFDRRHSLDEILPDVRTIMESVREAGDAALRGYTERFDGVRLDSFEVSADELACANESIDASVRRALEDAIAAVQCFHAAQVPSEEPVETAPGVRVWREWRPIERVGLYVPGGRGAYPSSVIMLGVPASIAGCREIMLCTPPQRDGSVPPATLVAADLVGVHRIFKLGGAQAIAAMAYGTETVPGVDKLFGAGNAYVTAAKLLAFPGCALDVPAGPSELLILADDGARPAWIAADLLSDVEHGPDSPAVLVTTSPGLAEAVAREIEVQLATLPRADIARDALSAWGLVLLADTLDDAIEATNEYAPEHLEIMTRDPHGALRRIHHAGSVFLGPYAPNAAGDYATGTNHVLPTAGYARTFSPVSLDEFGRMLQCQELTEAGLTGISSTVTALARAEELEGHARAVEVRARVEAR